MAERGFAGAPLRGATEEALGVVAAADAADEAEKAAPLLLPLPGNFNAGGCPIMAAKGEDCCIFLSSDE